MKDLTEGEKWKLFRNFMFNELGISKEDIKRWTKEAVYEIANNYVEHQFSPEIPKEIIERVVKNRWGNEWEIRDEVIKTIAQLYLKRVKVKIENGKVTFQED